MLKKLSPVNLLVSLLSILVFSATSYAQTVTSLSMTSDPGDYVGGGQTYLLTPTNGTFSASVNYDGGVSIAYQGFILGDFWNLDFAAPNNRH